MRRGDLDLGNDAIVRGVLAGGSARVVAVVTTDVAREAARRHQAGPAAALALARGLTSGLLLATLTKDDERVTLQVLGDGPLGGVTVDATAAGAARAYVKHPEAGQLLPGAGRRPSLGGSIGRSGVVSVIRDLGLGENFSGQTPLASGEIDEDVEQYLLASEQIPSALACEAWLAPEGRIEAAAGILIQALPGSDGAANVEAGRALLAAGALGRALGAGSCDAEALIAETFAGRLGEIQILDRRPVVFSCPCSRERAAASLSVLGEAEIASMVIEEGQAEVICNFCRARYEFSETELELLRREIAKPSGPPS